MDATLTPPRLAPALEMMLSVVKQAIDQLEEAPDGQLAVRNVGTLLSNILEVVEDDQRIHDGVDGVYSAALGLRETLDKSGDGAVVERRRRMLATSLDTLRNSLAHAKPNAVGRARHVVW